MDFGFHYVSDNSRLLLHSRRRRARARAATTPPRTKAASRTTSGSAGATCRAWSNYGRWRTFPATCDYSFQEARPSGLFRTYDGVRVYDGAYRYGATRLTPS